ncbi:hypothetical protein AAMO2058_000289000 [Amorphochlora amoebiformis]
MNFGLLGYIYYEKGSSGDQVKKLWSDDDCSSEPCDKCKDAGDAIVSFMAFGLLSALIAIWAVYLRKKSPAAWKKCLSVILCGVCSGLAFISWSTWVGGCHEEWYDYMKNSNSGKFEITLDAGFAVAMVAMVFAALASLNECCVKGNVVQTY